MGRGSWVVGRDGPVDPVDRVIRVWPCALRRRASLVTRHSSLITRHSSLVTHHSSLITRRLSVVGCRFLFIVVRRRWSNVGRTDWTERIAPFVTRHASPFSTFFVGKLVDILRIKRSTP
ncbi:hypothetical protein X947_5426 [Burkholderia pseudomallei MSHR7334]|nr:hypothetical protein X947_5426 [Burkholderia pseudomallei MSHR7334]